MKSQEHSGDSQELTNAIPRIERQDDLHAWWSGRSGERYWLEVTGRGDMGVDLRAPVANEQGKSFWSYGLLRYVERGDIVFHYDRNRSAITAVSRASGTQWPDAIVWAARGTSARDAGIEPHARPGLYVGLEDFKPLPDPLTLQQIRGAQEELETDLRELKKEVGEPMYFPIEMSQSRPLRPMQGYLFKLPRFFVELFPQLLSEILPPANAPMQLVPPGEYRRANELTSVAASDPFSVDPAIKERALRSHAATQNELADFLCSRGFVPRSPVGHQPNFDIGWDDGEVFWVAEVKSITDGNEEKQLRLGLGQVLRYRQVIGQTRLTRAALVTERQPNDESWLELCESLGVVVAWPGAWERLTVSSPISEEEVFKRFGKGEHR